MDMSKGCNYSRKSSLTLRGNLLEIGKRSTFSLCLLKVFDAPAISGIKCIQGR